MIIWTGRGFLAILVPVVTLFLGVMIFPENMLGYDFAFAGLLSAIFCWFVGKIWNRDMVVIDEETGEHFLLKGNRHTLFWIPMQYWGILWAVGGIIILFQYSIWGGIGLTVIFCVIALIEVKKYFDKNKVEAVADTGLKSPQPEIEKTETEEEILKRRAEKEDHSRFMPK